MYQKQKSYSLYVLRLRNNKWYVGITTKSPEERFMEHRDNIRAAAWTRLHRPIEIDDSIKLGEVSIDSAKRRENHATIKYMRKYGVNNVRGGSYTETEDYIVLPWGFYRRDVWDSIRSGSIGMAIMFTLLLAAVVISQLQK